MTARKSKAPTAANQRLVELVQAAFKASPLNRAELAERSGVPDGTLANLLIGKRPIYAEQMVGLAEALDVRVEDWIVEMRRVRDTTE